MLPWVAELQRGLGFLAAWLLDLRQRSRRQPVEFRYWCVKRCLQSTRLQHLSTGAPLVDSLVPFKTPSRPAIPWSASWSPAAGVRPRLRGESTQAARRWCCLRLGQRDVVCGLVARRTVIVMWFADSLSGVQFGVRTT